MGVPAIVINGEVKFVGVPGREDLIKAIKEALPQGSMNPPSGGEAV